MSRNYICGLCGNTCPSPRIETFTPVVYAHMDINETQFVCHSCYADWFETDTNEDNHGFGFCTKGVIEVDEEYNVLNLEDGALAAYLIT